MSDMVEAGDLVHFWNRRPGCTARKNFCYVKHISDDGQFARVEKLDDSYPSVVSLETSRLKLEVKGWTKLPETVQQAQLANLKRYRTVT